MKLEDRKIIRETLNSDDFRIEDTNYVDIYEVECEGNDYIVYVNNDNNNVDNLIEFYNVKSKLVCKITSVQ